MYHITLIEINLLLVLIRGKFSIFFVLMKTIRTVIFSVAYRVELSKVRLSICNCNKKTDFAAQSYEKSHLEPRVRPDT